MQLSYSVYDPMGNITILVTSPVPVSMRGSVAKHLMDTVPGAEQVGFLTDCRIPRTIREIEAPYSAETSTFSTMGRLEMAGGEFCGNATMSAASLIAGAQGLAAGEEVTIPLEVSGADGAINVQVLRETNDTGFQCTVEMPLPATVEIFDTS
jgi:diaminopimelate epimerase